VCKAQLEVARLVLASRERQRLGRGAVAVVGVNELEVGARAQILGGPAERGLECRVRVLDVAVEPRGDEQVDREREEPLRYAGEPNGRLSARVHALRSRPWVQSIRGGDVVRYA